MSQRRVPSILLDWPPVTLARTRCTLDGPVKVADSPAERLKCPKLWKRFGPTCRPRLAGTLYAGPLNGRAVPTEPSVLIAAMPLPEITDIAARNTADRRFRALDDMITLPVDS